MACLPGTRVFLCHTLNFLVAVTVAVVVVVVVVVVHIIV
jgi:hypothetical protein